MAEIDPYTDRRAGGEIILCEECLRLGHCRLGLVREYVVGELRARTELSCPRSYEGGPGVAHGGWTAAALDEALGHLALLCGEMTVTAKLTVEFIRPVPIETPVVVECWREAVERNRWIIAGELRLASTGAVLGAARGEFAIRNRERHFQKFRDWMARGGDPEG